MKKTFEFALVQGGLHVEPFKTFKSFKDLEDYNLDAEKGCDILKLINPLEGFNPNNCVLYTDFFWRRMNLKEELESGNILESEYKNAIREVIQEEKEELKQFEATKDK